MESSRSDVLGQYRTISHKLKKRFLRKPNVAEASEQFGLLAKELQQQECPHYAAFCCLAVARCEHTLGNAVGETQALVDGARSFLEAEQQNHQLNCPSFDEHLNAAISCYNHAVKVHLEEKQPSLAASLCMELGQTLRCLGKIKEATVHFQKAADLLSHCVADYLNVLDLVASCKIQLGDYDGALNVLTEMSVVAEEQGVSPTDNRVFGVFASLLAKIEVTRVLLLLLLQPSPQKLKSEHAETLEKYTWEVDEVNNSAGYLCEDLFLLLQSLVMACQSSDLETLKLLQKDLWPLLSAEQNTLLHEVLAVMNQAVG